MTTTPRPIQPGDTIERLEMRRIDGNIAEVWAEMVALSADEGGVAAYARDGKLWKLAADQRGRTWRVKA